MKPVVWLPNDTATRLHAVPGGTEYVPGTTVTTLCAPNAGRSLTFTPILGATLPRCKQCVRLSDPPPPSETGTPLGGAAGPAGGHDG